MKYGSNPSPKALVVSGMALILVVMMTVRVGVIFGFVRHRCISLAELILMGFPSFKYQGFSFDKFLGASIPGAEG
jgi:hypothetical protein